MDVRFPVIAEVVKTAAREAATMGKPVRVTVATAMRVAESRGIEGIKEIRAVLDSIRVKDVTDHYVCGQFENIQNGLLRREPTFVRKVDDSLAPSLPVDVPVVENGVPNE